MDPKVLDYQSGGSGRSGSYVLTSLSIMMFLQFFIWGAWYVTMGNFMDAKGMTAADKGWAYSVVPIAAIISPFFLGMVADRFFSSERVLAVMALLGAVTIVAAGYVAESGGGSTWFIIMLLLHALCYAPTLGLTNTVAMHNLTSQEKQFPIVRVFGTIGWIIASGYIVSKMLHADKSVEQFYIAGGASAVLGIFSFFLPHTPPPAKGQPVSAKAILGVDALALMKKPAFAVFIVSSFLICIPLAFYYAFAQSYVAASRFEEPGFIMSFGQVAEVVFMLIMPWFFVRLGVKWMLVMGMAAWVLRYGLFSAAAPAGVEALVIGGILLHGICYDFFFVTGFIYTDKQATKDIRGQAQGFLVLVTQGLGGLIGAQLAGLLGNSLVTGSSAAHRESFQTFWLIPCIMAGAVLVAFTLLFRDKGSSESKDSVQKQEAVHA